MCLDGHFVSKKCKGFSFVQYIYIYGDIQYVFLIICESSETAVEALKYSVYWTLE